MLVESKSPINVDDFADLSVTKNCAPRTAKPGDMLTIMLTVNNNGPSVAGGVIFTAPQPFGLSCMGISMDGGRSYEPWHGSYAIGKMDCNDSREFMLRGIVDIDIDGLVKMTARVTAKTPDADLSNNVATIKIVISPPKTQPDFSDTAYKHLRKLNRSVKRLTKAIAKLDVV